MTVFFITAHNRASGGTKVINQMVNLCIEKDIKSFLVSSDNNPSKATFLKLPAPTITLNKFSQICKKTDIVINSWQDKASFNIIKKCPCHIKIFWQHGASIPIYKDFNGEIVFKSKVYHQHWNVSKICAQYIKNKYKLKKISILHPYFDDQTLLDIKKKYRNYNKEGILLVRRRGHDIIPYIISIFPDIKFTILPKIYTDEQLYIEIIKHKFYISLDNGVQGKQLSNQLPKSVFQRLNTQFFKFQNIFGQLKKNQQRWIVPEGNLLGFPMTACESAWLGTVVIGFAMGGGLEWMNKENMYLARDAYLKSLIENINKAINDDGYTTNLKRKKAFKSVTEFNKENSWKQLKKYLSL